MFARAMGLGGDHIAYAPAPVAADAEGAAQRLAEAIRFRTISRDEETEDENDQGAADAFTDFAGFLRAAYPCAHRVLTRETVNGRSLVYRWAGSPAVFPGERDEARAPMGLIAHMDVVPVEAGTADEWTYPPFEGVVAEGKVWGRGALDNKGQLIALMEAVETLCRQDFAPGRDVYLLFGHDEEIGGRGGAARIAEMLKARGVRFGFTLDEGSGLVVGVVPGIDDPVALIATAEKGWVNIRLTARGTGGHSSAPAPEGAVSALARAVLAVNDHPHPAHIDADMVAFLHALAREGGFAQRLILGNLWLTGGLVKARLASSPLTAAAMRTTTAPTILSAGEKVNVLPQQASAVVNYRIHPRDTPESVTARAEALINDNSVLVESYDAQGPSPRSAIDSEAYGRIAESVGKIFAGAGVAPSLTLQGTDSKHYVARAVNQYRVTPFVYDSADLERIHGTDERIDIETLARAIDWYQDFITRAAEGE